jgi:filamentous hemagglutinin
LQNNVDQAQVRYDVNTSPKNAQKLERAKQDLEHAIRDNECLIKGCVPSEYIQGGQ